MPYPPPLVDRTSGVYSLYRAVRIYHELPDLGIGTISILPGLYREIHKGAVSAEMSGPVRLLSAFL